MARLTHMRISKNRDTTTSQVDEYELQLDWDNDRHQSVGIEDRSPESVLLGLHRLGSVVGKDLRDGKI